MAKRTRQNGSKRLSKRQRRARNQRWMIIGGILIGLVLVAGVAYAYLSRDQPGAKIADQGNRHLSAEPEEYIWNSRPPTSGPHAPQIASWGEHDESVPEWLQVHNLEDGGVIIHYNCPDGCLEDVATLRDIVNDVGEDRLILHPYINMDSRIALTAWTRLLTLDDVDRDEIVGFIDTYRGIDNH